MLKQAESGQLFGFTHGQYTMSIGEITGQSLIAQTVQKMWVDKMSPQEAVTWGQTGDGRRGPVAGWPHTADCITRCARRPQRVMRTPWTAQCS